MIFTNQMISTLTAVIGDATGHGLDAGMMVTASKRTFQESCICNLIYQ